MTRVGIFLQACGKFDVFHGANSYAKEKMELMKDAERTNNEEEVEKSESISKASLSILPPARSLGHLGKKENGPRNRHLTF